MTRGPHLHFDRQPTGGINKETKAESGESKAPLKIDPSKEPGILWKKFKK